MAVLKIQIFSVGDANGAVATLEICYSGDWLFEVARTGLYRYQEQIERTIQGFVP